MSFLVGSYPYFLLIILETIIFVFGKRFGDKKILKNIFFFLGVLFIFVFLVFKNDSVGTDTLSYKNVFNNICNSKKITTKKDIGFYGSMLLFSYISNSFFAYQFFLYLFIVSLYSLFIRLLSDDIFLSLQLFIYSIVFLMALSGIRQSVAMSLCSLSLCLFIKQKKYFKLFAIPIWIASCFFHSSSVVFSLMFISYFLKVNIQKRTIIIYVFIYLSSLVLGVWFFSFLYEIKDLTYFITSKNQGLPFGSLFHFFFLMVCMLLIVYFKEEGNDGDSFIVSCSWCLLLYCCFLSTSMFSSIISRFGFYFAPALIVFYSNGIGQLKPIEFKRIPLKTICYITIISCYALLFLYDCTFKNSLGTFPYKWRF